MCFSKVRNVYKESILHVTEVWFVALLLWGNTSFSNTQTTENFVERPLEEERIYSIKFERFILSNGIPVYQNATELMIPLGELMSMVEMAIRVDPFTGGADGWFYQEKNDFLLDTQQQRLVLQGKEQPFPSAGIERHQDDVYVEQRLLRDWFGLSFEVNERASAMTLSAAHILPFQTRLQREKKYQDFADRQNREQTQVNYPRLEVPYSLFGMPRFDVSLRASYRGHTEQEASADNLNTSHNIFAAGDLLGMTGKWFASGNDEEPLSNLRLTLERKDIEGNLTPLGLSEISLGDVFTPGVPLLSSSTSGRGVSVSNFPLYSVREFDRVTLRDDLPEGWQAELYRNNALIAIQTQPSEAGRYEFEDIELFVGDNDLRVVLHGPQGQVRESTQRFTVGGGAARPGEQHFALSVVEQHTSLFSGINGRSQHINAGRLKAVLEYQAGLSKSLSLRLDHGISGSNDPNTGEEEGYWQLTRLGLLSSFFGVVSELNVVSSRAPGEIPEGFEGDDEGYALQFSTQLDLLGLKTGVSHEHYFSDFRSEGVTSIGSDPITSRSSVVFNGNFPLVYQLPSLNNSVRLNYVRQDSGDGRFNFSHRLSTNYSRFYLTNTLTGSEDYENGEWQDFSLNGSFLLNLRNLFSLSSLRVRGGLNYRVQPESELNGLNLRASYRLSRHLGTHFSINRSLINGDMDYDASLNYQHRFMSLSLSGNYADSGNLGMSLGMNFSFDVHQQYAGVTREKNAGKGVVLSRVFLDYNGNGVFDEGDEPIEGAKLRLGRHSSDQESGDNGMVAAKSVSPYRPVNVSVDRSSLADAYWVPAIPGKEVVARPGGVYKTDFPVVQTGEIDGTVFFSSAGLKREVANIELDLVDRKGLTQQTVKTAYDGFYLFSQVMPGEYMVRVNPKQMQDAGFQHVYHRRVIISARGEVIEGMDFTLLDPNDLEQWRFAQKKQRLRYYEKSLALLLQIKNTAPRYLTVGSGNNNLHSAFHYGRYGRAIRYYEGALSVLKKNHGTYSPYIAACLNNLGAAWYLHGDEQKASRFFQGAAKIYSQLAGNYQHYHQTVSSNLAEIQRDTQQEYIAFYENISKSPLSLSQNLPPIFSVQGNRVREHSELKEHNNNQAIRHYAKAYTLMIQRHGRQHERVAHCLNNIGVALYHDGRYVDAIRYFERANTVLKQTQEKTAKKENQQQDRVAANLYLARHLMASLESLNTQQLKSPG